MLSELRVENLLLIERAELRLGPGLNVLTGETGAGKTVLAHALDLLLGGRARSGIVRPGRAETYVEGAFEVPDALRERLAEPLPEAAEEVGLARRGGGRRGGAGARGRRRERGRRPPGRSRARARRARRGRLRARRPGRAGARAAPGERRPRGRAAPLRAGRRGGARPPGRGR